MISLTLSTTTAANSSSSIQFLSKPFLSAKYSGFVKFRKPRKHLIFASKDDPKLDEWDQMELKFGKMIGEDPKITLAKIMGRKLYPDLSYLEIEKLLEKKKGKALHEEIEEIPFDMSDRKKSTKSVQGLNLVRPVPKKGTKFEAADKPVEADNKSSTRPTLQTTKESKSSVPKVILRKPSLFSDGGGGNGKSSKFGMKPNLSLKMRKEPQKERFSDITLLNRPMPLTNKPEIEEENGQSDSGDGKGGGVDEIGQKSLSYGSAAAGRIDAADITLLNRPIPLTDKLEIEEGNGHPDSGDGKGGVVDESGQTSLNYGSGAAGRIDAAVLLQKQELIKPNLDEGEQDSSSDNTESGSSNVVNEDNLDISNSVTQLETAPASNINQFMETGQTESGLDKGSAEDHMHMGSSGKTFTSNVPSRSIPLGTADTVLKGKPKRLDVSGKATGHKIKEEVIPMNPDISRNSLELENFLATSPSKEHEDGDWARAEQLVRTGEREEVELISFSTRGFVVSFGSLVGFLPYRNLAARWKFLAFESWLRRKGLDPSNYRQNLGIIGKYEATSMADTSESVVGSEIDHKSDGTITSDMKLEDLLMIYDKEKIKFLASFVGQRVKVGVVLADRNSRRLIFTIKPKEKEELVEKKRSLMAQLSVGDVVKCCIKKITYFGIFVEVDGVPALIHQSEVSWDATLNPASYYKVGQIVEAKVHQLDFSLERIFLSLKEITPDPLLEALEAVVGGHDSLGGELEAAQSDTEWADVETLIKELQQFDGIQSVSKGRYLLSPGLAPTFQVYMASMFENQYKLLARAGNRVQEVIVQTSLGKEELKSAILTCTNRVE